MSMVTRLHLTILLLCLLVPHDLLAQNLRISKPQYTSLYSVELQCPLQVQWTVCAADLGQASRNPSWQFANDIFHPMATASHEDFRGTGYHRGHLCPAADRSATIEDMRQTFAMSNVAPQFPGINMGAWKRTEDAVRRFTSMGDTIAVVVIPVFLNRDTIRIGSHRLAVPHAFFKAAWLTSNDSIIGSWFFFNHK